MYYGEEELSRQWRERYHPTYGVLRDEVKTSLSAYLDCGILCHGAVRAHCSNCKHSILISFSCKQRGLCPSCSAKRAVIFAEHLHGEVLEEVAHRHVVFSLPKRLRIYLKFNRKLGSAIFRAAWRSVRSYFRGYGVPGMVLTVQTAGDALNWNYHLHGIITSGCWNGAGEFAPYAAPNLERLTELFAKKVLREFVRRGVIEESVREQIMSQEHSGFGVWFGEEFSAQSSDYFVARYIERGPVSLERLSISNNQVCYLTKSGEEHRFEALDFLALMTSHIANKWEQTTRYYGKYSSRVRYRERVAREQLVPSPVVEDLSDFDEAPEPKSKASRSWAAAMKQVFEFNPLECPNCKSEMKIVACIHDSAEIAKICKSLGIPPATAPPALPKSMFRANHVYDC